MSKRLPTVSVVGPVVSRQDSVLVGVVIHGPGKHWSRSSTLEFEPEHLDALMVAVAEANRWSPAWQQEEMDQPLF